MADWDWFSKLHRALYRWSGGRFTARLAGMDMALLTTRGRRSGEARTTPLACFRDGESWIVVASNNGRERHPAWWLNLEALPEAVLQVGRRRFRVRAERAEGALRDRLWPWLCERNPFYRRYEKRTTRRIPVVVLHPLPETPAASASGPVPPASA